MLGREMGTTDKNVKPIASVLVVDDEESIRFSLSRFLQMENYQVFTASNIDEAVKILQEENVNLAILDLALSNAQNGEELVQYIYSTHLDCEMIMMSGYWFATSELTRGILRLQKPFTRKDIVELVEQSLTLRDNRLSKVREKILLQGIHLESEGGKAFLSNVLKLIINITQAQAGIITCKNNAQKTATAFLPFCQSPDDVQLPDPEFVQSIIETTSEPGFHFEPIVSDKNMPFSRWWSSQIYDSGQQPIGHLILLINENHFDKTTATVVFNYFAKKISAELDKEQRRAGRVSGEAFPETVKSEVTSGISNATEQFQLFEHARDLVVILSENGRIEQLNTAFETVTGLQRNRFLNKSFGTVVHEDDRETAMQLIRQTATGINPPTQNLRFITSGDAVCFGECCFTRIKKGGQHSPVLAIIRDVTNRQEIELQLRETEDKLMHSHKLKELGRLAGVIAHDFNNILTAINGHAELMLHRMNKTTEIREGILQISKAGRKAAALTRQLLSFSRHQSAGPKFMDVNQMLEDIHKLLQRLIREDVQQIWRLYDQPLTIFADSSMIEQVVMNLMVNARDAVGNNGVIEIDTGLMVITNANQPNVIPVSPGKYVYISVKDNGSGIPEEIRKKIFDPFFTTKSDNQGTGLGLSIIYDVAHRNSGGIHLETVEGEFTQLMVCFPYMKAPPLQVQDEITVENMPKGTETILLVEDESYVRNLISDILSVCGYNVLVSNDVYDALNIFEENARKIDLLITDMVMPGMNGKELSQVLAKIRPELKILFITGYSIDDPVFSRKNDNINFLLKPFSAKDLSVSVRKTIDSGRSGNNLKTNHIEAMQHG